MTRQFLSFGLAFLMLSQTIACTDGPSSSLNHNGVNHNTPAEVDAHANAAELTYYKDIKPLFDTKCVSCHSEGGLAPFELTEYAQVKGFRKSIKFAVVGRTMPPWSADAGHQTYSNDASLTADELSTLVAWIDAGAKEGAVDDYRRKSTVDEFIADVNLPVLPAGESYLPVQDRSDDYRCFIVPLGEEFNEKPFITGFSTVPGNAKIAHHLVAYYVTPDIVDVLRDLDAQEPGAGYQCYGGGLPDRIGAPDVQAALEAKTPGLVKKLNASNHWLAHWAPGDAGFSFPTDTGYKVAAGGALVMQMHYYSADAKGETDQNSVVGLKTAKTVLKPGFVYPLTNQEWLQSRKNRSMVIGAGETKTFETEQSMARVTGYGRHVLQLGADQVVKNVEIHSANLHMHAIGKSAVATLESVAAASVDLAPIPSPRPCLAIVKI